MPETHTLSIGDMVRLRCSVPARDARGSSLQMSSGAHARVYDITGDGRVMVGMDGGDGTLLARACVHPTQIDPLAA